VETQIKLDRFKPRSYQLPLFDAVENKGYKRVLLIWPRRAGKDMAAFNLAIRAAIRKVQVIYYIFPTYAQGKKVIFDSIDNDGNRILDYVPNELIESKNTQELKLRFVNGSLIQIVGSDNFDSLMGTNPKLCIFSEYSLQDPRAYSYIRPILTANDGVAIFLSTPRGRNHLWDLYQVASNSPDWFCQKLTVLDTGHISLHEIEKDKALGEMSEDLIQQEYYTSWDLGVEGSYYAKYIDRMRVKGQIGMVPWENGFKVHSVWDLGVRDSTTIIMFQVIGQSIRIINCYENSKVGLEHYAKVLEQMPYQWGRHIAPHDIRVKEFGSGMTRLEKAKSLGINFTIAPNVGIEDGIEAVRSALSKIWIDEKACAPLIKAMENYRQEYDHKRKVYSAHPLHDWSCFVGDTLLLTRNGMRQIMDIKSTDSILTLEGWMPCSRAKKTGINVPLVEVVFKDGTKVKCTPEHRFLLKDNKWISAKDLTNNSEIRSSLTSSHNIFREAYIDCSLANDILVKGDRACIAMFGEKHLDKFQEIATFITGIATLLTINSGTLSVSQQVSIWESLDRIAKDLVRKLEMLLRNGTDRMLADCGIIAKLSGFRDGQNGKEKKETASIARSDLSALLERMDMSRSFATQTARPLIIESVNLLKERSDVYCINVPDVEHFSLSNGAIVHNSHFSDAMRYLAVSLPKLSDGATGEDIDRRYNEARYGSNYNMPAVFRDDLPEMR